MELLILSILHKLNKRILLCRFCDAITFYDKVHILNFQQRKLTYRELKDMPMQGNTQYNHKGQKKISEAHFQLKRQDAW